MAAKMARSSYKSTAGQSQKPHDDSMAHRLDKILHSLDEVNYDPSSFTFNDDEDNNHSPLPRHPYQNHEKIKARPVQMHTRIVFYQ